MEIKEELLLNYLWDLQNYRKHDKSSSLFELNALSNLYRNYCNIQDFLDVNEIKNKNILLNYEDDIYTIDGKMLNQVQRVEFELNRIEIEFNGLYSDILEMLKKMLLEYIENEDKELLNYIKKEISYLQAGCDLDNNFLLASYEVFFEKYRNIYINSQDEYVKKSKNVR